MANTYTLIASSTVGSGGAATIDFTSIPATYTDLLILCSFRNDRAATEDAVKMSLNGSTSNFSTRSLSGSGSAAASDTNLVTAFGGMSVSATATASTFSNNIVYIPNYTSSTAKSYLADAVCETNGTTAFMYYIAGLWNPSTQAAITSISFTPNLATNFVQHSTAYLYGIKNS